MSKINFDMCFKKYYPNSYQVMSMMAEMDDETVEELTLKSIQFYDGSFQLEDSLMGAYIMHIAKGNIKGVNIDNIINSNKKIYNFSDDFINDVKNNLV